MSLGRKLAELREKSHESLQDVAAAVNVSKAHIWELEKGRATNPSMALVTKLANHFGVSIRYLTEEDVDAADADEQLARMFRQAKELEPKDREVLDDMLQSFLKRRKSADGS